MKKFLLVLAIGVYHCDAQVGLSKKQTIEVKNQSKPDFDIALKFINDYVKHLVASDKNGKREPSSTTWIKLNTLVTPAFKTKYKALGSLDADPILDAQDFPEKGFIISKTDPSQGYVTVTGIGAEWTEFKVILKVIQLNNKWLVDGSGIVNIPKSKQAKR